MDAVQLDSLRPRWLDSLPDRKRVGMSFDCPHCASSDEPYRLFVTFDKPLDGGPTIEGRHWSRSGDSFQTLTLSPSVDASAQGHWHGFVIDGRVR